MSSTTDLQEILSSAIAKKDQNNAFTRPKKKDERLNKEVAMLKKFSFSHVISEDISEKIFPKHYGSSFKTEKAYAEKPTRKWSLREFQVSSTTGDVKLTHWCRQDRQSNPYYFSKFDKHVNLIKLDQRLYESALIMSEWSFEETQNLFTLCQKYELKFPVIRDRHCIKYPNRTVEDVKKQYYDVTRLHTLNCENKNAKLDFDFDHKYETARKKQLDVFYRRTMNDIEEESKLVLEYRRIKREKKERLKLSSGIDDLISASNRSLVLLNTSKNADDPHSQIPNSADEATSSVHTQQISNTNSKRSSSQKTLGRSRNYSLSDSTSNSYTTPSAASQISKKIAEKIYNRNVYTLKFSEQRHSGTTLRSLKSRVSNSIGIRKVKAIEHALGELNLGLLKTPNESLSESYNELRCEIVLLYEMIIGLKTCIFDYETQKQRYEMLFPDNPLNLSDDSIKVDEMVENLGIFHNFEQEDMVIKKRRPNNL